MNFSNLKTQIMNPIKNLSSAWLKFTSFLILTLITVRSYAQDKGLDVDVNINKKGDDWYQQPWVWILAGLVFVLLLVAILRGNKRD